MENSGPATSCTEPPARLGVVVLRTQGGLGAQLFQLLYGRLLAQKLGLTLREVHDPRHLAQHARLLPIRPHPRPNATQLRISGWRIPRLWSMAIGRSLERPIRLGKDWYVDGHFQRAKHYRQFTDQALRQALQTLACELKMNPASLDECLVDLQLDDFFGNHDAARLNALTRLSACPEGATLMTNDEGLLREERLSKLMAARRAKLISTQGLSPIEVLHTMARYKRLDTGSSTLAVWCTLLAGTHVRFQEPRLAELACQLSAFAPWR